MNRYLFRVVVLAVVALVSWGTGCGAEPPAEAAGESGEAAHKEELRSSQPARPAPVIDESLLEVARNAPPIQPMEVVVWLRNRPGGKIARELREAHADELQALEERAKEIQASVRPQRPLSPEEEQRFRAELEQGRGLLSEQQQAEIEQIGARARSLKDQVRAELDQRMNAATAEGRGQFEQRLSALGGWVRGHITTQNAYEVTVPAGRLSALAGDPLVARVIQLPPEELMLDNQVVSLGLTSGFWPAGVRGVGMVAGVLDTGVQMNHPALSHLSFVSNIGTTDSDGHGTGVAGIIASADATYRGMAYGLSTMVVSGSSSSSVLSNTNWMVAKSGQVLDVINLSTGYGTANDVDYSTFDQFWDALVDDCDVPLTVAAGNNGEFNNDITHPASAFNVLAVANMHDQDTLSRADDIIYRLSSRGPTLGGRRKPDLAAPGQNTITTDNDWSTSWQFTMMGGTSAAAPHVAGGALLLANMIPSITPIANKAVLINTADAWSDNGTMDSFDDGPVAGSRWDKTYGWGSLNLYNAYWHGPHYFTSTVDDGVTPAGPDFKLYKGFMSAGEKATLVWNRHAVFNGSALPTLVEDLTDLDLYAYSAATGATLAGSASSIDNVEQIATAADGDVVLKVDVFGSLDPQVATESFALATQEGFAAATPPTFSFTGIPASTTIIPCGTTFTLRATVKNNGTVASYNNKVSVTLPSFMSVVSGSNPRTVTTIAAGASASVSWTVSAPPVCSGATTRTVTFNNSSQSYGETFTGSGTLTIHFVGAT